MEDPIKDLLESILKALVENPDKVKVEKKVDELGVLLTVKVADGDAGMVIGRQGKIIQAIRIVIEAMGMRKRARINIKLDVPERPSRNPGGGGSGLGLEL